MTRIAVVFMLILALANPAIAQERSSLLPDIPKATGEPHPEGNAFWRENHPALLLHDRDKTVREGIRDIDASLNGCLVCHSATGPDSKPIPANDPGGFCAVCHEYAAVRIDCFVCHRATPDDTDQGALKATLLPDVRPEPDDKPLIAYLEGLDGADPAQPAETEPGAGE